MKRGLFVAAAILMLVIGFGTAYAVKPTYASTTTVVTVTTNAPNSDLVNCVVTTYQVWVVAVSSAANTSTYSTQSIVHADYITGTAVQHAAGYSTVTTITDSTDSAGPGWTSTVCTWLPVG